jgi:hypothetical protein
MAVASVLLLPASDFGQAEVERSVALENRKDRVGTLQLIAVYSFFFVLK